MLNKFWTPWEPYFNARSSEEAVCLDRHWAAPNPEDILLSWGVLVETARYRDTEDKFWIFQCNVHLLNSPRQKSECL